MSERFINFRFDLMSKIKASKHHCYGMFTDGFVEDYAFDDENYQNCGNLYLKYKDGNTINLSLDKDDIEPAENFINYLRINKIILKPKAKNTEVTTKEIHDFYIDLVKKDIPNLAFISDETVANMTTRNQKRIKNEGIRAKNGYLYNKKDLNVFNTFYTYGGTYEVEHRDARKSDLLE